MNQRMNMILIRKKNKVILPLVGSSCDIRLVATVMKNLEEYGYALSSEAVSTLQKCNTTDVISFYDQITSILANMTGFTNYQPMYPNFPKQVMDASDVKLYMNAMLHYFGKRIGYVIVPKYEKEFRSLLTEKTELTVIGVGSINDYRTLIRNLIYSKTSISEYDMEAIRLAVVDNIVELKDVIPHKEISAEVCAALLRSSQIDSKLLSKNIRTPTDVLRISTAFNFGDVSLSSSTMFKSLSRKIRRTLLYYLNNCKSLDSRMAVEQVARHRMKWVRLSEILHPGEYKDSYPRAYQLFEKVRKSNRDVRRNHKSIEKLINEDRSDKVLKILVQNPGDFARRLDHLLRMSYDVGPVFTEEIVEKLSVPLLLQIKNHFEHRNERKTRTFIPKGTMAKMYCTDAQLKRISDKQCRITVERCKLALVKKFSKRERLGKVYIDPDLTNYVVPFSQRSASKSSKTIPRFSRVSFPEGNTIRMFLYWKGENVDIDLSGIFISESLNILGRISYTKLRWIHACHSGDIVTAPNGASEYIDIPIDKMLKKNVRYILLNVFAFSCTSFNSLDECSSGWMMRKEPQSGEIYEPKTVKNKIDLTSDSRMNIPCIFDIKERKMIWCDLSAGSSKGLGSLMNVEHTTKTSKIILKGILDMKKHNIYDLLHMHAEARGEIVKDKDEADIKFTKDDIVYETDRIVGEFL